MTKRSRNAKMSCEKGERNRTSKTKTKTVGTHKMKHLRVSKSHTNHREPISKTLEEPKEKKVEPSTCAKTVEEPKEKKKEPAAAPKTVEEPKEKKKEPMAAPKTVEEPKEKKKEPVKEQKKKEVVKAQKKKELNIDATQEDVIKMTGTVSC